MPDIRRGQVHWWKCPDHNRTYVQGGVRPVVIVSNDHCNRYCKSITVVPLTTSVKLPYPERVPIIFDGKISTALADQITTISVDELSGFVCDLSSYQLDQIDTAIALQLGFTTIYDHPYAWSNKKD